MKPVEITTANFQTEVLESDVPVLLDFWAGWCGPCRMVAPILDEVAAEYDGRVKVGKVDVDAEPQVAGAFGVQGIPFLVLMDKDKVVAHTVGVRPKAALVSELGLDKLPASPVG